MKFHDTLNEKLFNKLTNRTTGEHCFVLKRAVSSRLKGIAHAFMDFAQIPAEAVEDIRIVGSSASYNYTKYSDLDLHLVINEDKLHEDCPIVHSYLYAMKNEFNVEHDITIYGIPVEIYTEPVGQPANSNGIWSLEKGWIKEPKPIPPTENDAAVKAKVDDLVGAIKWVRGMGDGKIAKEVLKRIYDMRKAGLAEGGEFSTENLAFKQLRNKGLLDKLRELTKEDIDRELSLESLQENKEESDMEKINELIFRLRAMLMVLKSEHYYNVGYESHLLADRLIDEMGGEDILDSLKEQGILAFNTLPLQAKQYLEGAMKYVFEVGEDDRENWLKFKALLDETRVYINGIKHTERGVNALLDNIAQGLCTCSALIYIQTRRTDRVSEGLEDVKAKLDHTDGKETKVDRKEFKEVVPKRAEAEKIAKTVVKQSDEEQDLDVASESILDKLARELGVE